MGAFRGVPLGVMLAVAVSVALSLAALASAQGTVLVQTPLGEVRGLQGDGVDRFLGIKFGSIPARFKAAEPIPSWRGRPAVNATSYGAYCTQSASSSYPGVPTSEDCLFLNIYRPTSATRAAPLPVMFWIYGGGFNNGASNDPQFEGSVLASTQGVIVVSINYRVGPLGFMVTDDTGTGGLGGLADQILALQWVKDNIGAFGGDEKRVTVFGESAGSLSTCMLVVSPLARGLFRRAILESGACTGTEWGPSDNATAAFEFATWYASTLGAKSVADLQDASKYPTSKFVGWPSGMQVPAGLHSYSTCVDGHVLPAHPRALYTSGPLNVDAIMIGANTFDGLGPWFKGSPLFPTSPFAYVSLINFLVGGERAAAVGAAYDDKQYTDVGQAFVQMEGDHSVLCPARTLAALCATHLPGRTFFYVFGHLYGRDISHEKGIVALDAEHATYASHTAEIAFAFHAETGLNHNTGAVETVPFSDKEHDFSLHVMQYWTSFGGSADGVPAGNATWPAVTSTTPTSETTKLANVMMLQADSLTVAADYHDTHCAAFDETW
mmetsp:Transcript_19392/g.68659  ORF Transcript_19392/g.68659 Transcript_19392/m.68659 type:complete len:551 (-) Transcript_19392:103-1755(-)